MTAILLHTWPGACAHVNNRIGSPGNLLPWAAPRLSRSQHRKPGPSRSQVKSVICIQACLCLWVLHTHPATSVNMCVFAYHYYYSDRFDWPVWAGLGVMPSSIGHSCQPPCSSLLLRRQLTTSGSDGFRGLLLLQHTANISILAAFTPTGPNIRDLVPHPSRPPSHFVK